MDLRSRITPPLFSQGGVDEWTLSQTLGKSAALKLLRQHWATFITRADLVAIQAAGLTSVRIPLGFWSVDVAPWEPYVQGQYPYLVSTLDSSQERSYDTDPCRA